jgi:tRNA A-37 threonylcarbamoyl transferase component Bud32/Flp pilus assembly protein TadD
MAVKLGRYRLDSKIADGGMASVWRGFDEDLHRAVAVKVMRDVIQKDAVFAERFVREARTIASFDHPNILSVYDFGSSPDVYLVLPLIEGGSLKDRLGAPIPLPLVVDWLRQVAAALDYAHARGVLHRDIKPANIMVNREGHLLLADFGIARSTELTGLTQTGDLLGTPNYMSPEQAIGRILDGRSDQYSLAVMGYEMLTGSVPFHADTPLLVLNQHVRDMPEPPSRRIPGIPPEVDAVFARALAKDPLDRYSTCSEFVEHLARAVGAPMQPISPDATPTHILVPSPASTPAVRVSRNRIVLALAIVGGMVLLVLGAFVAKRVVAERRSPPVPTPVAAAATSEPASVEAPKAGAVSSPAAAPGVAATEPTASVPPSSELARGTETSLASAAPPARVLREKTERNRAEPLPPSRLIAQPLIRSGAAAALSPELAEAYRALEARGRALSREDFARARGLATEVAASHPDDREAIFLRDFCAAAIDFADGNQANAVLLLRRALAAAPNGVVNRHAAHFAREALAAGHLTQDRESGWQLGLVFGDIRGDLKEELDRALERNPGNARVLSARAVYFRDRGETRRAREEARAACDAAAGSYPIACELARDFAAR